jgi:hypothetical protein
MSAVAVFVMVVVEVRTGQRVMRGTLPLATVPF